MDLELRADSHGDDTEMPETAVIPDAHDRGAGFASDEVAQMCAACPHPWAAHDAIGTRYCAATSAGHFNRGCVCTSTPT